MLEMTTPIETLYDKQDKILFFHNLSKEEIKEIVTDVKLVTLKEGDILMREGDTNAQDIYYILTGSLN